MIADCPGVIGPPRRRECCNLTRYRTSGPVRQDDFAELLVVQLDCLSVLVLARDPDRLILIYESVEPWLPLQHIKEDFLLVDLVECLLRRRDTDRPVVRHVVR